MQCCIIAHKALIKLHLYVLYKLLYILYNDCIPAF